jgi:hypothetical protein
MKREMVQETLMGKYFFEQDSESTENKSTNKQMDYIKLKISEQQWRQ